MAAPFCYSKANVTSLVSDACMHKLFHARCLKKHKHLYSHVHRLTVSLGWVTNKPGLTNAIKQTFTQVFNHFNGKQAAMLANNTC